MLGISSESECMNFGAKKTSQQCSERIRSGLKGDHRWAGEVVLRCRSMALRKGVFRGTVCGGAPGRVGRRGGRAYGRSPIWDCAQECPQDATCCGTARLYAEPT